MSGRTSAGDWRGGGTVPSCRAISRAVWKDGEYGRTLDLAETKFFFQDLLDRLGTDYIDIGMIHMVDNKADFDAIFNGEIYRYVLEQKRKGSSGRSGSAAIFPRLRSKP
ncbi:MAG: hypothetical protein V8T86_06015 [Victivallis sp.]